MSVTIETVPYNISLLIDSGSWATEAALAAKANELREAGAEDVTVELSLIQNAVSISFYVDGEPSDYEAASNRATEILKAALRDHPHFSIGYKLTAR